MGCYTMKSKNENGFTLIEMMIVLVVITILGALVLPNMDRVFSKNKLRSSTTSVTSSLYLARMKAINKGEPYGVEFFGDRSYQILKDPYGTAEVFGTPYNLDDEISFEDVTFIDWLAVFNEYGQLHKNCIPTGVSTGTVRISDGSADTTMVEVTHISGRIRETNR